MEERYASEALGPLADGRRQIGLGPKIGDVMNPPFLDDPAGHAFRERGDVAPDFLGPRSPPRRNPHHIVVADSIDANLVRPEQPLAGLEDRVEHGGGVRHQLADHAQHVRGGRLVV